MQSRKLRHAIKPGTPEHVTMEHPRSPGITEHGTAEHQRNSRNTTEQWQNTGITEHHRS